MELETRWVREDRYTLSRGSFIDLEYVLHVVESGSLLYQNEEDRFKVSAGDMIYIGPNKLHAILEDDQTVMTVIHFLDHSHRLEGMDVPPTITLKRESFQNVQELTRLLRENWNGNSRERKVFCDGLTQAILGLYLDSSRNVHPPRPRYQFRNWESVKMAVQYIQNNYSDQNLCVDRVSRHVQLSYNYFSALFKKYTNENPLTFITRVRLERAKTLLYNHQTNITEVASACGFRSLQNFSKTFKKHEGMAPSVWLKTNQY